MKFMSRYWHGLQINIILRCLACRNSVKKALIASHLPIHFRETAIVPQAKGAIALRVMNLLKTSRGT